MILNLNKAKKTLISKILKMIVQIPPCLLMTPTQKEMTKLADSFIRSVTKRCVIKEFYLMSVTEMYK